MKKIIVYEASDIRPLKAGIGYYSYMLLKYLAESKDSFEIFAFTNNKTNLEEFKKYKNVTIVEIKSEKPNLKWIWVFSKSAKKLKYDYVLSPSYFIVSLLLKNTVQLVMDVTPLKHPKLYGFISSFKFFVYLIVAGIFCHRFFTISKNTLDELIQIFPLARKKTFFLGIGINNWVFDIPIGSLATFDSQIPYKYFFSVNSIFPKKNYTTAIKAFKNVSEIYPDIFFLVAGNNKTEHFTKEIWPLILSLGLESKVMFLGYVNESQLAYLYDNCVCNIYLSVHEGAGLSPLEAYARGKKTILSDTKIHREIMGEKAILVRLEDIDHIAKEMEKSLKLKNLEIDEGFLAKYKWENIVKDFKTLLTK